MSILDRRRLLQLSGALALSAASPALANARRLDEMLGDDWSADVAILRQAWETMHPGLLRYTAPGEIEDRLDGLATAWAAPSSFRSRFLALSRVTASLKCGHTYPSPYNGGEAVVSRLYPDRALVPFRFRWIDGTMVITEDLTSTGQFKPGMVVTAINGVNARSLLDQLIPLARADGSNDRKRISLMEVRGDDRFETFDIHLPLILPLRDAADFSTVDGRTIRADLLTLADRKAALPATADPAPDANPWSLMQDQDGVARLTMPGWGLYNSTFDWKAWLGGVMDDLSGSGARGLIIDIRGNEGGLDCGDVILSRLIDADLALSRQQRWVRYRRAPENLHPYLDTWDKSFLDWGDQAVASEDRPGFYRLTRYDDGDETAVIKPDGVRFRGKVAVLCDASNSSATFNFCQNAKNNRLARLIGETTGGNRRGINGGAFCFLKLPISGVVVDLPLIASFPVTPEPDAGIVPDAEVLMTARDIGLGRDPQMQAATAFVQST